MTITPTLRRLALHVLQEPSPEGKVALARALAESDAPVGAAERLDDPGGLPARPARPELLAHTAMRAPSMASPEGRAALLHAIAHIELNAIDLACDAVWRFADLPDAFYRDWIRVADEEGLHFTLLRDHLRSLGFDYGDFPAHRALWDMAERTRDDLLARLALVPRTLEARGLDASPAVKRKLVGAGDLRAGEILDVILRDEIGHVEAGNRWYLWECHRRGVDPESSYDELLRRHEAPKARGPFNLEARRAAGFSERELAALEG